MEHLLYGNRQRADPYAGRVTNRIRDGSRHSSDGELPDALCSYRVHRIGSPTNSTSTSRTSALASIVITVYVPVPISVAPLRTKAVPSRRIDAMALHGG